MDNCLAEAELSELGKSVGSEFERRIAALPKDLCAAFRAEARNLETELLFFYRTVALCAKKTEDLKSVSLLWAVVVRTCDKSLTQLAELTKAHSACKADDYYDRVLDLRAKCERLRQMHA